MIQQHTKHQMMKYSVEELKESTQINTLESYYKSYQKFISICIGVLSIFGTNSNIDDDINSDLKEFLNEKFPEIDDIDKLKSNIEAVKIKNLIKSTGANKIPRFNIKLYAFIYDLLLIFLNRSLIMKQLQQIIFLEMFIDLLRSKFISTILM